MPKQQNSVHVFIDEVGTVSSATVEGGYGYGWVMCRSRDVSSIESLLAGNDLEKVHLRELSIP